MKALFIGGTGTISGAATRRALAQGWELYLLNRGNRLAPDGAKQIRADIQDEAAVREALGSMHFDVVADFIAYAPEQVERDVRLFRGRTSQYLFISSASAYQKPLGNPVVTESTPLMNPYWHYSRQKIDCEMLLMDQYRSGGFPMTIVRPSHTYCERSVPVALHGRKGSYAVLERMRRGKKVILHGDGSSLWTLTWADDFAEAFVGLMGDVHAIGEAYQITADESLTWNQIYATIASALGTEAKLVHIPSDVLGIAQPEWIGALIGDKANSVIFDNGKIKRAVPGFVPATRFDEGVRKALEYIGTHPECQTEDPEFDDWCDRVVEWWERTGYEIPRF